MGSWGLSTVYLQAYSAAMPLKPPGVQIILVRPSLGRTGAGQAHTNYDEDDFSPQCEVF